MAHSSLATYIRYSPNCSKPRNHVIDSIAIHTMAGNLTVESCGEWFSQTRSKASSNYGIDSAGNIAVYVEEENRSWCTSSRGVDNRAVTIEVASTTTSEPYAVTEEAYEALLRLVTDICQRNNIYELKWKNDMHYGLAAANGGPVRDQNMFVHRWFNLKKSCPGQWLFMRMGQIAEEVNRRIKSGKIEAMSAANGSIASYDTGYSYPYGNVTLADINYKEFKPYIVTLTRNSRIKYDGLSDAGVIGAVVEAGYRFESNRLKSYKFDNQNLEEQVDHLEKADIPYGLFTYARARSSKEAEEEMYYLYFPVMRHPPALGVWLQLELGKNSTDNKYIMDVYQKELDKMGLTGKMGIIATPYQLSLINWDNYKDTFYLWSIDHVSKLDDIDKVLDPSFFDMEDKLEYYKSGQSVLNRPNISNRL